MKLNFTTMIRRITVQASLGIMGDQLKPPPGYYSTIVLKRLRGAPQLITDYSKKRQSFGQPMKFFRVWDIALRRIILAVIPTNATLSDCLDTGSGVGPWWLWLLQSSWILWRLLESINNLHPVVWVPVPVAYISPRNSIFILKLTERIPKI